ncbi:MAG: dihydropteroate synthase [Proteobacteria bacterium]|nr:dihydropteroate synthase [Pseudomonadota bacterium]
MWGSFRLTDPGLAAEPAGRVYLRPVGLLTGAGARAAVEAGAARWLAGGAVAFLALEVLVRSDDTVARRAGPLAEVVAWAGAQAAPLAEHVAATIERLAAPRPPFAGLALDRPRLMGVVNVTPDSFSDGGDAFLAADARARGLDLVAAGAELIDIGGESTRPGSEAVSENEELARVMPVIEGLRREPAAADAVLSIDTRRARVMRAAVDAGARVVNDVTALAGDPGSLDAVARSGAAAVLMHMRGEPRTMQENPTYAYAPLDVFDALAARVAAAEAAGIARARIAVDPGIGFGKTVAHNLEILGHLALFHGLGCALALGVSRKSFIGRLSRGEPPKGRIAGTIAANQVGLAQGAQVLRVHDVAEARQALAVWRAIAAEG